MKEIPTRFEERSEVMTSPAPLDAVSCARKLGFVKMVKILLVESRCWKMFLTNFLLTYNLRAGVSLVVRLLTIVRTNPKSLFSLKDLIHEKNFLFREEAVRMGLLIGLFTSIYKAVLFFLGKFNFYRHLFSRRIPEKSLSRLSTEDFKRLDDSQKLGFTSPLNMVNNFHVKSEKWHSAAAGFVAGFSVLAMEPSWHRSLALYMGTRVVQSIYNYNKARGLFHFWGSSWNHGDALLFMVFTAQVFYGYVMRPDTLPVSYFRFLVKHGPLDPAMLKHIQNSCRGRTVDVQKALKYIISQAKGNVEIVKNVLPYFFNVNKKIIENSNVDLLNVESIMAGFPMKEKVRLIPLQALQSFTTNSLIAIVSTFYNTARQIFPVYFAMALVPAVVLRYQHFLKAPMTTLITSTMRGLQSSAFLGACTGIFYSCVTLQRWFVESRFIHSISELTDVADIAKIKVYDHRLVYWIVGFFGCLGILVERKGRRSELALYTFPRGADSLYLLLVQRGILPSIPFGEVLLFCASMAGVMFFYENHHENLSPLVGNLLARFLNNDVVFKDQERLEDFTGFEDLERVSWEDLEKGELEMTRMESDISIAASE